MSFPKYKEDVFVCFADTNGNNLARRAGYKFYTYDRYADAELYEVDTKRGFGTPLHQSGASVVFYPDLPSKKDDEVMITFKDKVLEFVLDPARTNSNLLIKDLADKNFFNTDEKNQRQIVNELLASSDFCTPGKDKFREHMGAYLEPTVTTFIMEVTSEHFDEGLGDAVASDIMTALKKKWGTHTELGKLVVKFVEVK